MSPEKWADIKRYFGEALEVAEQDRGGWLKAHCPDEAVRGEVLGLLEEYGESKGFLEEGGPGARAQLLEQALVGKIAGEKIGDYRLVREIGRGGMGLVFEAIREGEDFQRRFALKLIWSGMSLEPLTVRFRRERLILSRLEHPGIVALLDGGATPGGLPYLVMEYIEGRPIDEWCRERELPARAIVELMLEVCECLSYAHRRLVVHRDLKPSNLLVTADGRPKLLDFGIAKVMGGDALPLEGESATGTGLLLMTPEFASPEQLRGQAVTTASDIYSLGVLLYLLLAKVKPYRLGDAPLAEAIRQVLEVEPKRPSDAAGDELRRTLAGDLDNIILKCLRKEPEARYASVEALADDLQAWLDRREVRATEPTFGYRASRWIARNRPIAVTIAGIAVSLMVGAGATAWQARVAQEARLRAEIRSQEIERMARALLFEIHESISRVPGSTETRELLLRHATDFLDGAAKAAGDDLKLRLGLAQGYSRLGAVLGTANSENLGQREKALATVSKARVLAEQVVAGRPGELEPLDTLAEILSQYGLLSAGMNRGADLASAADGLEALVQKMVELKTRYAARQLAVAIHLSQLAQLRTVQEEFGRAEQLYDRAIQMFKSLPQEAAGRVETRSHLAFACKRLGALLIRANQFDAAETRYREALAIERDLLGQDPADQRKRYALTFTLSDLGLIAKRRKKPAEAVPYFREAAEIRDAAVAADPKDVRALSGAVNVHCHLAELLGMLSKFPEARHEAGMCLELQNRHWRATKLEWACRGPASAHFILAEVEAKSAEAGPPTYRDASLRRMKKELEAGIEAGAACQQGREGLEREANRLKARHEELVGEARRARPPAEANGVAGQ